MILVDPLDLIDPPPFEAHPLWCPLCGTAAPTPILLGAHTAHGDEPAWPRQLLWRCGTCGGQTNTRCMDAGPDVDWSRLAELETAVAAYQEADRVVTRVARGQDVIAAAVAMFPAYARPVWDCDSDLPTDRGF